MIATVLLMFITSSGLYLGYENQAVRLVVHSHIVRAMCWVEFFARPRCALPSSPRKLPPHPPRRNGGGPGGGGPECGGVAAWRISGGWPECGGPGHRGLTSDRSQRTVKSWRVPLLTLCMSGGCRRGRVTGIDWVRAFDFSICLPPSSRRQYLRRERSKTVPAGFGILIFGLLDYLAHSVCRPLQCSIVTSTAKDKSCAR